MVYSVDRDRVSGEGQQPSKCWGHAHPLDAPPTQPWTKQLSIAPSVSRVATSLWTNYNGIDFSYSIFHFLLSVSLQFLNADIVSHISTTIANTRRINGQLQDRTLSNVIECLYKVVEPLQHSFIIISPCMLFILRFRVQICKRILMVKSKRNHYA